MVYFLKSNVFRRRLGAGSDLGLMVVCRGRSECSSRRSSGDWKESSPSTSAPGAKIRSLLPGVARPRSRTDLSAAAAQACSGGGRPISVQPRPRRCSYSVQSETETTSDFIVEPESEGRRSRGSVSAMNETLSDMTAYAMYVLSWEGKWK